MATAIRPIGHEDRLSLVEHLDELRTRLIICVITVCVALAVAFWQNHALLSILNEPLKETTKSAAKHASGPIGESARFNLALRGLLRQNGCDRSAVSSVLSRTRLSNVSWAGR